jgi:hypothetical protein
LWIVLRQRAPLSAGRRSGLPGLAAAVAVTGGFLLNQLLGVPAAATWTASLAVLLTAGALATRHDGGPVSGLGAALRAVLIAIPAWFIVSITTASRAISLDARDPATIAFARSRGATSIRARAAGDAPGGSIVILTAVSALTALVLLLGARAARNLQRNPPRPLTAACTGAGDLRATGQADPRGPAGER